MDYLSSVPAELYIETLYLVPPETIFAVCLTNKYASNLCDEKFYQNYINKHYSRYNTWTKEDLWDANVPTWKELLNILINGITVKAEAVILERRPTSEIVERTSFLITVKIEDTAETLYKTVFNKTVFDKISVNQDELLSLITYLVSEVRQQQLVLKFSEWGVDSDNPYWDVSFHSLAYLPKEMPKIPHRIMEKLYDKKISSSTPISRMKSFYFNLSKIWVYAELLS
jgi:hypothetical protein